MCGIAGYINLKRQPVSSEILSKMASSLSHRGPNEQNYILDNHVGFAHTRLTILDPNTGQQPLKDPASQCMMTYNGEIYNYKELKRNIYNYTYEGNCDTEVVLASYLKSGIECLKNFQGMFGLAIFDPHKRKLFLARDHVGIKPVYYCTTENTFAFSSELTPLMHLTDFKKEINPEAVSQFFEFGNIPTPNTIYKNVFKLEAGHYLAVDIDTGQFQKQRYWHVPVQKTNKSEKHYLEELDAIFNDIIPLHMRSDVPFGAFLSGGVDSSIICALMQQHSDKHIKTFSIGFENNDYSELDFANHAAKTLKTNHFTKTLNGHEVFQHLEKIALTFGEPFADSSALPTFLLSQQAAQHVPMVLSGDGADELFAGYKSYERIFDHHNLNLPQKLINKLKRIQTPNWYTTHIGQRRFMSQDIYRSLSKSSNLCDFVSPSLRDLSDKILFCQHHDLENYLQNDILVKVDRMSMLNSLEVRVPFLDKKMIEFALSLTLDQKIRITPQGLVSKYLLKRYGEKFFSKSFLHRKKMGFGIPLAEWLRGPLQTKLETELKNAHDILDNYIKIDKLNQLIVDFRNGNDSLATPLWVLFSFAIWANTVHQK